MSINRFAGVSSNVNMGSKYYLRLYLSSVAREAVRSPVTYCAVLGGFVILIAFAAYCWMSHNSYVRALKEKRDALKKEHDVLKEENYALRESLKNNTVLVDEQQDGENEPSTNSFIKPGNVETSIVVYGLNKLNKNKEVYTPQQNDHSTTVVALSTRDNKERKNLPIVWSERRENGVCIRSRSIENYPKELLEHNNQKGYEGILQLIESRSDAVKLLQNFPNIHEVDDEKRTFLHRTVIYQAIKDCLKNIKNEDYQAILILEALIDEEIDVNAKDNYGKTVLHWACEAGFVEIVKVLLNNGAKVDIKDVDSRTPLHYACEKGFKEIVDDLIKAGSDIDAKDINADTPFDLACFNGHEEIVKALLLTKGYDEYNSAHQDSSRSLRYVRYNGYYYIERLLLNGGDTTDSYQESRDVSKNNDNNNEFIKQNKIPTEDIVTSEESNDNSVNNSTDINAQDNQVKILLHSFCQKGKKDILDAAIKKGSVDIDGKDVNEKTALHLACESGLVGIVKVLLENGADMNIKGKDGKTALHLACESRSLKIVELLLEKKAKINIKGKDGKTALHLACESGSLEIVKVLLKNGANMNIKGKYGKTALHVAYEAGFVEIKDLLKAKGAKDIPDDHGYTALYYDYCNKQGIKHNKNTAYITNLEAQAQDEGIYNDELQSMKQDRYVLYSTIVDSMCNKNFQDSEGKTLLHHAVINKRTHYAEFLLEQGLSSCIKDNEGKIPFDYADKNMKCSLQSVLDHNTKIRNYTTLSGNPSTQSPGTSCNIPLNVSNYLRPNISFEENENSRTRTR